jgi:hypothetical protein
LRKYTTRGVPHDKNAPQRFKDEVSRMAHGITRDEAIERDICVDCKKPNPLQRCTTELAMKEYYISGVCGECWDNLFKHLKED